MFKNRINAARNFVRNAPAKVAAGGAAIYALGMSGLASAAIDTTEVNAALSAAQASGEGTGGKVIAVVAGLVVVGVIIALVRKV